MICGGEPDLADDGAEVVDGADAEHRGQPQIVDLTAAREATGAQRAEKEEQQHRVQPRPQHREQHVVVLEPPDGHEGEHRDRREGGEGDQSNRRAGGDVGGRHGEGIAAQRVEAVGRAADAPAAVDPAQLATVLQLEDVDLGPVVFVRRRAGERQPAVQPAVGEIDVVVVLRVRAQPAPRCAEVGARECQVDDDGATPSAQKTRESEARQPRR